MTWATRPTRLLVVASLLVGAAGAAFLLRVLAGAAVAMSVFLAFWFG
jgi:hypothetical protein